MKVIFTKSLNWRLRQRYHFSIKSSNGRILCHSEQYCNLKDCTDAFILIQQQVAGCKVIHLFEKALIE